MRPFDNQNGNNDPFLIYSNFTVTDIQDMGIICSGPCYSADPTYVQLGASLGKNCW